MRTRGELSHPLDHDSCQFLPISSEFLPLNNWTVVLVTFPTRSVLSRVKLHRDRSVLHFGLDCCTSFSGSCIFLIGFVLSSVEFQVTENIQNQCYSLFTLCGECWGNTVPCRQAWSIFVGVLYSSGFAW